MPIRDQIRSSRIQQASSGVATQDPKKTGVSDSEATEAPSVFLGFVVLNRKAHGRLDKYLE